MKSLYILLLALAVSAVSCRTKEGEPGPAGESSLNKQGSITGTITYTDDDGNDATAPFNFEYYESLSDNQFYYGDSEGEYYELAFGRRALNDNNNFFNIEAYGSVTNGVEEEPSYSNINFSFLTIINNELYEFYDNGFEISNVSLDPVTGRLTFDFSGTTYYGYDDNLASITGRVDVILNRSNSYLDIYYPITEAMAK